MPELDPTIRDYYELGLEAGRLTGGFPSGPLEFERTKELIFRREIDISMAQMGAPKIADLGPQFLMWKDEEDLRRNRR